MVAQVGFCTVSLSVVAEVDYASPSSQSGMFWPLVIHSSLACKHNVVEKPFVLLAWLTDVWYVVTVRV